jgi:hypothetical protein
MAMTIFLVLNGMGVVFMGYVLTAFWKEGHRQMHNGRKRSTEDWITERAELCEVTQPISGRSTYALSVIPFRAPNRFNGKSAYGTASREASTLPIRQISTR